MQRCGRCVQTTRKTNCNVLFQKPNFSNKVNLSTTNLNSIANKAYSSFNKFSTNLSSGLEFANINPCNSFPMKSYRSSNLKHICNFGPLLILCIIILAPTLGLAKSVQSYQQKYYDYVDQLNRPEQLSHNEMGKDQLLKINTTRVKRQYYEDNYYGSYYGWQAGRLIGWLLGFIVLMTIICVPCICCIGIWFAGWFGVRQAMISRRRSAPPSGTMHHYPPGYVMPQPAPPTPLVVTANPLHQPTTIVRHHERSNTHMEEVQHMSPNVMQSRRSNEGIIYTHNNTPEERYYERRLRRSPPLPPQHHHANSTESREHHHETRRM